PKADEIAVRERVLGWAGTYVQDPDWFIQKAVAWWLRDLSKHDAPRVREFLALYGEQMKPFARKEASKHLT
ncbi:MAG: DNA alkylation repair protein, partial [Marinosulfonomonas sp.]|nr:DNA alkylation repair protein [Marinosulfonomonas sp.]